MHMRHLITPTLLLLSALGVGCSPLPPTHIYTNNKYPYSNDGYAPERQDEGKPGELSAEGKDFCRHLENRARVRAIEQSYGGWTLGILSALAFGAGTVLTASAGESPTTARQVLNASLPIAGASLGYISFGMFGREKDASALAATAAAAVNLDDAKANEACNAAISEWNGARSTSSAILMDALKAAQDENKALKKRDKDAPKGDDKATSAKDGG
jgi:hypothetical protein